MTLRTGSWICALACVVAGTWADAEPLKGSRPNIILVITDDQGMGDLSCMGNTLVRTPNIDRFHAGATRLTDFQVSPTCAPTRAAIMSGRAPFKVGVTHTILQRERMALDVFTMPQALKTAGYATGLFGKWHLGDEEDRLPQSRGFDEVLMHGAGGIGQTRFGDFPLNEENVYFDNVLLHNDTVVQTKGFCTDLFFSAGLAWIKKQHEAKVPYFAYISLNAPHGPFVAPESYKKRLLDEGCDDRSAARLGMIENIDDNFGRLISSLEKWKALENTLVIFMTDNGAVRLGRTKRTPYFNAGMKSGKNSPNEGGTHVPFFAQWKGKLGAGVDIDGLTSHIDLYQTFSELAGAELPEDMQDLDGRSLLPLLENPKAEWPDRELFVHCGRWPEGKRDEFKFRKCAVRTQRWRLVNNEELYDISNDPGETKDIASTHPEVVEKLRKSYEQWWTSTLPLMVNEGLPTIAPKDQPFALRYEEQLKKKGIPDWAPTTVSTTPLDGAANRAQEPATKSAAAKVISTGTPTIEPNWDSLAAGYEVPDWFVDGKLGVWFHWGIPSAADENRPNDGSHYGRRMYSPPAEGKADEELDMSETLTKWHIKRYGPLEEFGYEDLIPHFKGENWDPEGIVRFVKENGARFIMPVATHHDNFDMYDSSHPWNALKMGPKRDTLKEWKAAATKHGLKFGVSTHLYWSPRFFANARKYQKPGTPEWSLFNMDYDPRSYSTQDSWNEHWYARCWEVIEKYDPDMFNNDSPYPKTGGGKGLGIKLFTDFINRDLKENHGKQSVVLSFKDGNANREAFTYNLERGSAGEIKPEPWMWATDLSGGWFYRATAVNRMSIPVMVGNAVDAISKNGVVMLNVALKGDGTIPDNQAAYLTAFGDFLKINGEGIYGTRPWKIFGEGPLKIKDGRQGENKKDYSQEDIRFTTRDGHLYAFVLAPPNGEIVIKSLATGGVLKKQISSIELMGSDEALKWTRNAEALTIQLPGELPGEIVNGFRFQLK